jgi:hypothetical protein
MKTYSEIIWPSDLAEARKHLIKFFLVGLDPYRGRLFSTNAKNDPFEICQQFLDGEIDLASYDSTTDVWWDFLAESDGLRGPKNRMHAIARVALCMLSVGCDEPLEEQLSFFLESVFALDRQMYEKINRNVDDWFEFLSD